MEQPSVSVVIPVFNGERYLQQAIASALEQTYPPHEVVVVDDGSTDASRSIVESFGGKVICKIQQNLGPSAARNLGTEVSTGEWIAYLDADDYWLPDKLEKQIERDESDLGRFALQLVLQHGEIGSAILSRHDDFAVDYRRTGA